MSQGVALIPIFEVCAREQGFGWGGHQRKIWRRQEVLDEVLRAKLAEASREVWIRQRQQDMGDVQVDGGPHGSIILERGDVEIMRQEVRVRYK